MRRPTLCLLLLLALTRCDAFESITGPDDGVSQLSGTVTAQSTGGPYVPATVTLFDGSPNYRYSSVNDQGQYRIRDLQPGRYTLVLTLGSRSYTREGLRETIEIAPGANVRDFVVR